MKSLQLKVSEVGVGIEKQLDFLADALEQKLDYDEHEELANALFPVAQILRSISEKVHQDFETLWSEIYSSQEAKEEA